MFFIPPTIAFEVNCKIKKYLEMKDQPTITRKGIYSKSSTGLFYSPFNFSIDKMEHLLLINFEKDTDQYYNVFELQKAHDAENRVRLLIIAYRVDGAVDIYHHDSYPMGSQAAILNDPNFFVRPLDDALFEIDSDNLKAYFSFNDKYGRLIKVEVNEHRRLRKRPFFMLAPIGVVAKNPETFPVYSLYDMSFTIRKHTNIAIEIGGKKHKPDTFFLPFNCASNYFSRYSADTFNVDWNKIFKGNLNPLIPEKENIYSDHGTIYQLINNEGHYEIERMSTKSRNHQIAVFFQPPIPDIACLQSQIALNGKFNITTDNTSGNIGGNYSLKNVDNKVSIVIHPSLGWQPNEHRWLLKLLYKVVKIFKEWPIDYQWNAEIVFDHPNSVGMISAWKRISNFSGKFNS